MIHISFGLPFLIYLLTGVVITALDISFSRPLKTTFKYIKMVFLWPLYLIFIAVNHQIASDRRHDEFMRNIERDFLAGIEAREERNARRRARRRENQMREDLRITYTTPTLRRGKKDDRNNGHSVKFTVKKNITVIPFINTRLLDVE